VAGQSEHLNISKSSIFAAIDIAEDELGAKIFNRTPTKGVETTNAGKRFLAIGHRLKEAENDFTQAVNELADRPPATLRIGCGPAFGGLFLINVIKIFMTQHPHVHIVLYEGWTDELEKWLIEGAVDVVIAYDLGFDQAEEVLPICRLPPHAVIGNDNPLAEQAYVTLEELSEQPYILLEPQRVANFHMAMFDIFAKRPRIVLRSRSSETVRSAVASGLGCSILHMKPFGDRKTDRQPFKRIPIIDDLPFATLVIADMYGAKKPKYLLSLIDTVRQIFLDAGPAEFSVTAPERMGEVLNVAPK